MSKGIFFCLRKVYVPMMPLVQAEVFGRYVSERSKGCVCNMKTLDKHLLNGHWWH